jgi:hypothetical protein
MGKKLTNDVCGEIRTAILKHSLDDAAAVLVEAVAQDVLLDFVD